MLRELVEHFGRKDSLPVEVPDIERMILDRKLVDQIVFIPDPHMDPGVARGFLYRYESEVPGPKDVAEIYYATKLDDTWLRIVWAKELMNICDNGDQAAATQDNVEKLVAEMVLPPGLTVSGCEPSYSDQVAIVWALLVLFPKPHRDKLKPYLESGKTSVTDLAKLAWVPERYIPWIMSPSYDGWYGRLMAGA